MDERLRKTLDEIKGKFDTGKCDEIFVHITTLFNENKCTTAEVSYILTMLKEFETLKLIKFCIKENE